MPAVWWSPQDSDITSRYKQFEGNTFIAIQQGQQQQLCFSQEQERSPIEPIHAEGQNRFQGQPKDAVWFSLKTRGKCMNFR